MFIGTLFIFAIRLSGIVLVDRAHSSDYRHLSFPALPHNLGSFVFFRLALFVVIVIALFAVVVLAVVAVKGRLAFLTPRAELSCISGTCFTHFVRVLHGATYTKNKLNK